MNSENLEVAQDWALFSTYRRLVAYPHGARRAPASARALRRSADPVRVPGVTALRGSH